ncbi:uncharacterized protein LACBIDRAFT_332839 [Laccaria bicolor S238N-H82]|uniref:Predicted protein n=1 Tax=Laccaria bicolor (strain S238N-H82 / ATCC MYA-4686) TaxID=486041 RepID=B0DU19_LACBS|nr:uncharacterized protein LACBIDRAFT_332839 [Laccaria bicolor S238N-H82]EDR01871.1 predicted protein [Laccaria bicolor S238N-H82]|eukprot:XP_001887481.1 predicted protein [Laccaria bicolor S238N-H82]
MSVFAFKFTSNTSPPLERANSDGSDTTSSTSLHRRANSDASDTFNSTIFPECAISDAADVFTLTMGHGCVIPLPHSTTTFHIPNYDPGLAFIEEPHSTPVNQLIGTFEYDRENGYDLQWDSWAEMESFVCAEEERKNIELVRKEIWRNKRPNKRWVETHYFVCARQGAGGASKYTKKKPGWTRSVPLKRTRCDCRLTVKTYPGMSVVLGAYQSEHMHMIGQENACFTRLPDAARTEIERGLTLKKLWAMALPPSAALSLQSPTTN